MVERKLRDLSEIEVRKRVHEGLPNILSNGITVHDGNISLDKLDIILKLIYADHLLENSARLLNKTYLNVGNVFYCFPGIFEREIKMDVSICTETKTAKSYRVCFYADEPETRYLTLESVGLIPRFKSIPCEGA